MTLGKHAPTAEARPWARDSTGRPSWRPLLAGSHRRRRRVSAAPGRHGLPDEVVGRALSGPYRSFRDRGAPRSSTSPGRRGL